MSASRGEITAAVASARSASGLDEKAFEKEVQSQYGSEAAFEQALQRDLLIKKFISEKISPSGTELMTARAAVGKWLQDASADSTIRIALAENGGKTGCGDGCGMAGKQRHKQPAGGHHQE